MLSPLRESAPPSTAPPFAASRLTDEATGWTLAQLGYRPAAGEPGLPLEVRLAPAAGSNLFSFMAGGHELLHQPERLGELVEHRFGTPLLFPTPNRVRDGSLRFEGRTFTFPINHQTNFIHGLARDCPFRLTRLAAGPDAARAETVLDWRPEQPRWEHFPIRHRLRVRFVLRRRSLRIAYRVRNDDQARLPFGFGLHPFFRIPGARSEVWLRLPLGRRMEAEGRLPTGRLLPVSGTAHDLRRWTSLPGLDLDDVYFGMDPDKAARFELRQPGLRVRLTASDSFSHVVVYTPPDRPFFCVENQTCSTDAHNLWDQGQRQVSHLQILAPGESASGHVDWRVTRQLHPLPG